MITARLAPRGAGSTPLLVGVLAMGLLTGCGGHKPSGRSSASTAAAVSSQSAAPLDSRDLTAPPLEVVHVSHSGELAVFEFNAPLDPDTLTLGLQAFEDRDLDPGGDFSHTGASPWLDPSGRTLLVRAGAATPHEIRLQLTDALLSKDGRPLSGGAESAAISFREDGAPEPVFELRFRPRPLPEPGAVAQNTGDDHGDELGSATLLRQSADGVIEAAADRDWFSCELLAGRPLVLRTETQGDTILTLYAANGQTLASNDDDPNGGRQSRIEYTASESGTFYAEVRGYGDSTPSYKIVLEGPGAQAEAGDELATALVVALGERVEESLGSADLDHYALDLSAGTELRVGVDHPDVNLIALDDQGLGFTDPVHVVAAGETLGVIARQYGLDYRDLAALNGIDDPNRIDVGQRLHVPARDELSLVSSGGRVYVRASGFEGARPSYALDFRGPAAPTPGPPPAPNPDDHGQDAAGATSLTLGSPAAGVIEQSGDLDWFALDLREGKSYELATTTQGDSILRLRDQSGAQLAENDDDEGKRSSRLVFRAPATKRYYVEVAGYGDQTLSYEVSASERVPGSLPRPSRFQPRRGTDVWHIDFQLRADLFARDLASRGLSSGDAETDRLMRERVIDELLSFLSQKFRLAGDGGAIRGRSWKISFTADDPPGRAGWSYSREAVGGSHEDGSRTLGVSYLDPGNKRKEDNDDLGELGIFSASIQGRNSTLRPSLRASDKRYLDGTYLLGDGSASDDRRFRRVRQVASDWAHALAVVTAHEVGHSVGLDHDESLNRGIMRPSLSSTLLSDLQTRFADPSAQTLTDNLGTD